MKTREFDFAGCGTPENVVWFDIECVKEAISSPLWSLKTRTVPVMVGTAEVVGGKLVYTATETEAETIDWLQKLVDEGKELRYSATKKYDEMVVTGRWTYTRRAMASVPGPWRAVVGGKFRNIRSVSVPTGIERDSDISSGDIWLVWNERSYREAIEIHNLRDCLMLVAEDPDVNLTDEVRAEFQRVCRN